MKNVKFRGIPLQKDEFRLKFCGKNPNSAARLEIPRPAENCGPYLYVSVCTCMANIALARSVAYWILSEYWRWLNDWTSQAPQLSGDSSPGCIAAYRSLYPHMRASQVTNWKLRLLLSL